MTQQALENSFDELWAKKTVKAFESRKTGDEWFAMGCAYGNEGKYRLAIRCFKKALADESFDNTDGAWLMMGCSYNEMSCFQKAIACYKKMERNPGYAWYGMGGVYAKKGEHQQAIACCENALADKSFEMTGDAWHRMGDAYDGRYPISKKCCITPAKKTDRLWVFHLSPARKRLPIQKCSMK